MVIGSKERGEFLFGIALDWVVRDELANLDRGEREKEAQGCCCEKLGDK